MGSIKSGWAVWNDGVSEGGDDDRPARPTDVTPRMRGTNVRADGPEEARKERPRGSSYSSSNTLPSRTLTLLSPTPRDVIIDPLSAVNLSSSRQMWLGSHSEEIWA